MHGQAIQQSDFFALGRTFVFLLTGREPGDFYNVQTGELKWQEATLGVKPEFALLLNQMMENIPSARPKSTQLISQRLTEINSHKLVNQSVNQQAPIPPTIITGQATVKEDYNYANILKRFFAYTLDLIFLLIIGTFVGGFLSSSLGFDSEFTGESMAGGFLGAFGWFFGSLFLSVPDISAIAKASLIINLILNWLYFTGLESSRLKATFGKLLLGLKVVDLQDNKISFMKANIRYWSKIISILMLMIGFIMIAFTSKKQGSHDMLAKTIVLKK